MPKTKSNIPADQYNDPKLDYRDYWQGREYEHEAEELAIRRLLKNRHFAHALDVGGGYGRLCILLEKYADKVTLAETSQKQLDVANEFLKDHPNVDKQLMPASAKLDCNDSSIDLITMIRVMHHLPEPLEQLNEINRVLSSDGCAIIEVANNAHARNRLKYFLSGKKVPLKPVDVRSKDHRTDDFIAFVDHNPEMIKRQFAKAGFEIVKVLSVSNLRNPKLKKILPKQLMMSVEASVQSLLAPISFGPSLFFLVRKRS